METLQPLTGRRLVTLALNVPGPMAVERLRDLGASVTKLEPPSGDPLRAASPSWYSLLTKHVTVETCDLKTPAGQARLQSLLADADLLLTAQRLSALTRLGLAWKDLHTKYPRLCHVAIVGERSPRSDMAGHDLTYLAANDLVQPPSLPPTLFADVAGSEQATVAALAVLMERDRTGAGQFVEVALADAARRLAAPRIAGLCLPGAGLGGGLPGYGVYRTKDGWIAVAALEPHFLHALCQQLHAKAPDARLFAERFAQETSAHWVALAEQHDLPIAEVAYTAAP